MTGEQPAADRIVIATAAINNNQPVVATISSLSEGVNLSRAKHVIFAEESYVPGEMHQALRRVQRWTEDKRPVLVHYVRTRGTVDQSVHRAQTNRQTSAQQILKDALQ